MPHTKSDKPQLSPRWPHPCLHLKYFSQNHLCAFPQETLRFYLGVLERKKEQHPIDENICRGCRHPGITLHVDTVGFQSRQPWVKEAKEDAPKGKSELSPKQLVLPTKVRLSGVSQTLSFSYLGARFNRHSYSGQLIIKVIRHSLPFELCPLLLLLIFKQHKRIYRFEQNSFWSILSLFIN